jgi:uridine kinase
MFLHRPIGNTMSLASLIAAWSSVGGRSQTQTKPTTTIVGIDGPAGAGKSSLCSALAAIDSAIAIVHMDDFFVPPTLRVAPDEEVGRQIDWRLVINQVVALLANGLPGHYQRFDWATYALQEWHDVPTGGIVLLDGVYSTREEISPFLAQRIWVTVPRDLGLQRGIDRDGEKSRDWWMTDWVEDEDRYILMDRPEDLADVVIDGTRGLEHFQRGEYVRVR